MSTQFNSLFFALILIPISAFSAQSKNKECLSEFQQAWDNNRVWHMMKESCPIGKALWSQEPNNDKGIFWIQCGVLAHLPESWFSDLLTKNLPNEKIVLKPEEGHFRCLAGPFYSFEKAKKVKEEFQKHAQLKDAFIRDVSFFETPLSPIENNKKILLEPTPPPPSVHATNNVVTQIYNPEYSMLPVKKKHARDYFNVAGVLSPRPHSNELQYASDDKLWWRATLNEAKNACKNDGMRLISTAKLKALANTENTKAQLPNRLPFWVQEERAFDLTMKLPLDLTPNSALYVLCELSDEENASKIPQDSK